MKIDRIELFHISIPFAKPYKLSKVYGTLVDAHAVILKMYTDTGVIGFGEADPMNPFTEETPGTVMAVVRDTMAAHLLGKDPMQLARLEATLDRVINGNPTARGAVNMALFDILGKVHQVPAYHFLGGLCHPTIPLLGPIGNGTPEQDAEAIESLFDQGYRTVMIKMGALPIAEEIQRTISAVKHFGQRMAIILDANQAWQYKETLKFIRGIQGFEPDMIEQPVARTEIASLAAIRNVLPCLLSADESLVNVEDMAKLIRAQAADAYSIKVSKNGGLSKSLVMAKTAEAFGHQCLMNSMLEFGITQAASLHLGCALPNLLPMGHAYMSVLRMIDDVTDFHKNISKAVVAVPEGPGLGIAVDEDKLNRYCLEQVDITR